MEQRRRVPRRRAGWRGVCRFDDDPRSPRYDCTVVDISILGAGLLIYGLAGLAHHALVGHRLVVEIDPLDGASITLKVRGDVKHASATPEGAVRAGIEFHGLSDAQRSVLGALAQLQETR
jgi:hypothetical protein